MLDAIDRRILAELQEDGRMTNVELARRAGISAPPCLRRVRRLEEAGIIRGYHADTDPQRWAGRSRSSRSSGWRARRKACCRRSSGWWRTWPEVRECHMIRGGGDFLLKLVARDTAHENQLTQRLTGADACQPGADAADHPHQPGAGRRSALIGPLAALAALTALRLIVAAATPLAPDEAYYWVWSRALAPGFLDHPPMVALWIRARHRARRRRRARACGCWPRWRRRSARVLLAQAGRDLLGTRALGRARRPCC